MLRDVVSGKAWIILTAAIALGAAGYGQDKTERFDGRWVIPPDAWFDRTATAASGQGRGGRGTQAPQQDIVLELRVTATGGISGRATGVSGRRGAPGSHPAHDVEITRGGIKGDTLTFQIWQFDGFHNRLHVTARRAGDDLALEFRRETPKGSDTFPTRARRASY
jgi:hypothetical protein